jgi:hypothetical protein
MPTKGHSTVVQYGDTADIATATTWTRVATRVTEAEGPNLEAEDIDTSHMESVDQAEEFVSGWYNGGEPTVTAQFSKSEYQFAKETLFRADKAYRIVFFDGATIKWNGYLKGLGTPVERKGLVMCALTFKVSGKPVYAAAS